MQNKLPKWIPILIIILSFIGFLDSTYLTYGHYSGSALKCAVFSDCDTVTTSEYSVIFGIPLALLGVIFYIGMLLLSVIYLDTKNRFIPRLLILGGLVGVSCSAYFVYLQIFVLRAICDYCMVSALISSIFFILALIMLFKKYFR